MTIPPTFRAGDTVAWRDDATTDSLGVAVTSAAWSLSYFLRSTTAGATGGLTVASTAYGSGWQTTISSTNSATLAAGSYYWQARATSGAQAITIGSGSLTVLAALNYTGAPAAFDGRSQARKDLDAVQAAIRSLISGGAVKRYTIGTRQLERFSLAELIELENRLKADVAKEEAAQRMANGLGDPRNLFVRFG
jgi:hypothetical protein